MGGSGVVGPYDRAEAENMVLRTLGLASRRDEQGLRDHLKAVLGRLTALGLPAAGLAPWFLTVIYLAPEVALDDTVVASLYETLWDRFGNDGVAAARFFLDKGDVPAASAVVATLLKHRSNEPAVRSLATTCRLASALASCRNGRAES